LPEVWLERQYNDILMGHRGKRRVIVTASARKSGLPPGSIPGKQIQLTIDYDLQQWRSNL